MSTQRIDSARSTVLVEPARTRQTERPATPFRQVLAGSVNVLMSGAESATSLIAGPVLAAAVHETRAEVVKGIAGEGPARGRPGDAPGAGAAVGDGLDFGTLHAMQRDSQSFNLQLLALQEEVQQENRQFSTISNVLRARHDTAKAAVANIRS